MKLVRSGSTATLDFYLSNFTDTASLANAIRNIPFRRGSTKMADGLRMARTQIFNAANGDRANVPNVIVLVTDGKPSSKSSVQREVRLIRNVGIKIVGVGVTNSVSLHIISDFLCTFLIRQIY